MWGKNLLGKTKIWNIYQHLGKTPWEKKLLGEKAIGKNGLGKTLGNRFAPLFLHPAW